MKIILEPSATPSGVKGYQEIKSRLFIAIIEYKVEI
jgi:hypothetical protein